MAKKEYVINKFTIIIRIIAHIVQILLLTALLIYRTNFGIFVIVLLVWQISSIGQILYIYLSKVQKLVFSEDAIVIFEKNQERRILSKNILNVKIEFGKQVSFYKRAFLKIYLKNNTAAIHDISHIDRSGDFINEIENLI